jgi:predicted Rossmann fold flavoprotein
MKTVAIIGGGASGMTAAITAAQNPVNRVILLEKQPRVGRKLLSTGNGRCNLSNRETDVSRYHGGDSTFVKPALEKFNVKKTLEFFRALGLFCVTEEDGKIYPLSNHATSVVDVLRFALEQSPVSLHTDCAVLGVSQNDVGFAIKAQCGVFEADRVIVACGGAAGTYLGGGLDGYQLLESLGHRKTDLFPSLVQIKTDPLYPKALKGVKADAAVTVMCSGNQIACSRGEVLFTEYGVSGPVVFDISRAVAAKAEGISIKLDFLADYSWEEITEHLIERQKNAAMRPANQLLTGMLQNRLGQMVCKAAGLSGGTRAGVLSEQEIKAAATAAKKFYLKVWGTTGFENAQVTAGGMDTAEFDPNSLQSRLVPGLFACGEVLDVDGDCGGFNLQWAWSSGRLAGRLGE